MALHQRQTLIVHVVGMFSIIGLWPMVGDITSGATDAVIRFVVHPLFWVCVLGVIGVVGYWSRLKSAPAFTAIALVIAIPMWQTWAGSGHYVNLAPFLDLYAYAGSQDGVYVGMSAALQIGEQSVGLSQHPHETAYVGVNLLALGLFVALRYRSDQSLTAALFGPMARRRRVSQSMLQSNPVVSITVGVFVFAATVYAFYLGFAVAGWGLSGAIVSALAALVVFGWMAVYIPFALVLLPLLYLILSFFDGVH